MSEDSSSRRKDSSPKREKSSLKDTVPARTFMVTLGIGAGITSLLTLVLFLSFYALGFDGAPYWAVGIAVVVGSYVRRTLLPHPGLLQTFVFSLGTVGGALLGLWMANGILTP